MRHPYRFLRRNALLLAAALAAPLAAQAGTVVKDPDDPIGPAILGLDYSSVYANSFVAPNDGNVTEMGVWLRNAQSGRVRFEVVDSLGGDPANGPDTGHVLALSPVDEGYHPDLTFIDFSSGITDFGTLTAGHTYWLAATTVGLDNTGRYAAAWHDRNTDGIVDNGMFRWSNDPAGRLFEPPIAEFQEMAFSVTVSPVPEPAQLAMLGLGLPLLAARLRARKRAS